MKNYHYILGIKETSTLDEIKIAYRKLSKKFHPDMNDGDKFFEERFKDIKEAYDVLSSVAKTSNSSHSRPHTYSQTTNSSYSSSRTNIKNKRAYFSFDEYYGQFKQKAQPREKLLVKQTKKLIFFVLLPLIGLLTSMNYISKEIKNDDNVSPAQYQKITKAMNQLNSLKLNNQYASLSGNEKNVIK